MNYNTQNAKIASITEKTLIVMQGLLTGAIMSTRKSLLLSVMTKPDLLLLKHG